MTEAAEMQLSRRASKALERFEEAVRQHAFKGAGHPEDIPDIQREYKQAKAQLVAVILDGQENG